MVEKVKFISYKEKFIKSYRGEIMSEVPVFRVNVFYAY
jgi:hypothetical protein